MICAHHVADFVDLLDDGWMKLPVCLPSVNAIRLDEQAAMAPVWHGKVLCGLGGCVDESRRRAVVAYELATQRKKNYLANRTREKARVSRRATVPKRRSYKTRPRGRPRNSAKSSPT